ncbi:MAG: type II secretion system F family protein [Bacillota bacterium]
MPLLIGLLAGAACLLLLLPSPRPAGGWEGAGAPEPEGLMARLERRLRESRLPLSLRQYLCLMIGIPVATLVAARLLTGAWLTALICLPAGPLVTSALFDFLARHRTRTLRDQLQEVLLSLATSLKAGQSLANALERCLVDLRRLHPRGGPIVTEMEIVVREVQMSTPVDQALLGLRERLPLEEVASLVDAVVATRRRGGNIVEVMGNVAHMLADRMAIDREIQVMTAQKRAEAAILSLLPLGIYLVIRFGSPEYMAVFHQTVGGQIALGLIFLAIITGYWMANRLARIDL